MTLDDSLSGGFCHVRGSSMESRGHDLDPPGRGIARGHYIGNYQRSICIYHGPGRAL